MNQLLYKVFRGLLAVAITGSMMLPTAALAAIIDSPSTTSVNTASLDTGAEVIKTILRVITTVSVILFVILLVVGGIQYLGSFGNEESTTKAKKLIIDAVVGLFIVLSAFGIASFIFGQLGINVGNVNTFLNR